MFTKINRIVLIFVFLFTYFNNVNAGLVPGTIQTNLSLSTSSPGIIVGRSDTCEPGYNSQKNAGKCCNSADRNSHPNNSGYCTATSYTSSSYDFKSLVGLYENGGY